MADYDDNLGDLPNDIGTDHNQLIDVPPAALPGTGAPGGDARRRKAKRAAAAVPAWARWLAGALVPNLSPSLQFSARPFSIGTTAEELSGGKASRRYLLIQNLSAGILFVGFDSEPSATSGLKIPPGGFFEPLRVPKNSIYIIGDAPDLSGYLVEG